MAGRGGTGRAGTGSHEELERALALRDVAIIETEVPIPALLQGDLAQFERVGGME